MLKWNLDVLGIIIYDFTKMIQTSVFFDLDQLEC